MLLDVALTSAEEAGKIKFIFSGDRDIAEAISMQLWLKNLDGDFFTTFNEASNIIGRYEVDYSKRFIYGLHPLSVEELAVYFLYALPCVVPFPVVSFAKDCLSEWFDRSLLYKEKDRALSVIDLLKVENNESVFAVQL